MFGEGDGSWGCRAGRETLASAERQAALAWLNTPNTQTGKVICLPSIGHSQEQGAHIRPSVTKHLIAYCPVHRQFIILNLFLWEYTCYLCNVRDCRTPLVNTNRLSRAPVRYNRLLSVVNVKRICTDCIQLSAFRQPSPSSLKTKQFISNKHFACSPLTDMEIETDGEVCPVYVFRDFIWPGVHFCGPRKIILHYFFIKYWKTTTNPTARKTSLL